MLSSVGVLDLGTVKQGEVVSASFEIENNHTEVVKVTSVGGSCGCIAIKIEPFSLQPGDIASIDFSINTANKMGLVHKTVYVYYVEGPDAKVLSQKVKCTITNDSTHK